MMKQRLRLCIACMAALLWQQAIAQNIQWTTSGDAYYKAENGEIARYTLPGFTHETVVEKAKLIPAGSSAPLKVRSFSFSADGKKMLIYTNSQRVWRRDTRGDYWVLDVASGKLSQLGKKQPAASLMFAKFSPNGEQVAYVSRHNLYTENVATGAVKALTTDGTDRLINGTFDWAYEEEFDCRDGFRWSADSKHIAYWQIDARAIRNFLMINNTDSIYSFTVPVEYPKVGEDPSACKVGVVDVSSGKTSWMQVPGDTRQHYIPRMEWAANNTEIILQQLNRKQNESHVFICNIATGAAKQVITETSKAWIDVKALPADEAAGWEWLHDGKDFLWVSEKDGYRHIYLVSRDGKSEKLATKGNYDVISINAIDDKTGNVYFMASPYNATQQYLYRINANGSGDSVRLSPATQPGTHGYDVSPNGMYASHSYSNINTPGTRDWVRLPAHEVIKSNGVRAVSRVVVSPATFFQVTTEDGITLDGWMVKPLHFDSTKKYPVLFTVYTEPASQTVRDAYGAAYNGLYTGSLANDGYIQISLDGRGTPAPKGTAWRQAIYRNIGRINIRDQAMAAKKILEWPFVDSSRIAVWGWSGGGSTTLNLLFQYPDIYKTGIAIAAVANQLTYDNIYQERYMGIPQENREDFVKGSPITYAKNLRGKLLLIHGTGDDNVHYQNAEMVINELIKNNKVFQLMVYPNRTHGIYEGEGTSEHLASTFTEFLQRNCPGGGR
ncbi:S9 family peptidase [Deminuibacter soli]|uniref:S9 family peptidase n=1 Tax=Deminuibacter soli TaxID=2291815 RepID=A0A3E1NDU9_9BACT|nr:S9 family peptidase [Deminuibacter soli]RFM26042.1 S9 family peptidase [Deminuibacter soli]